MAESQNIEYIDAWGRGTLKIFNSCKEHGLPEPLISEKEGGFIVIRDTFEKSQKLLNTLKEIVK